MNQPSEIPTQPTPGQAISNTLGWMTHLMRQLPTQPTWGHAYQPLSGGHSHTPGVIDQPSESPKDPHPCTMYGLSMLLTWSLWQ